MTAFLAHHFRIDTQLLPGSQHTDLWPGSEIWSRSAFAALTQTYIHLQSHRLTERSDLSHLMTGSASQRTRRAASLCDCRGSAACFKDSMQQCLEPHCVSQHATQRQQSSQTSGGTADNYTVTKATTPPPSRKTATDGTNHRRGTPEARPNLCTRSLLWVGELFEILPFSGSGLKVPAVIEPPSISYHTAAVIT